MADVEEEAAPAEGGEENEEVEEAKPEEEEEGPEEIEEEAFEEAQADPFERLDEESEDNEEQNRMYREYLDLTKQIDCQKRVIENLKERKNELMERQCQTRRDKAEIKKLRTCLDQENIKLHTMTNRAVQLQNFGSGRLYGDIELPMDEQEQSMF
ncbi:hypothetical protein KR093_000409, partial [Drosophila rubida]